jgi:hypothetical protein
LSLNLARPLALLVEVKDAETDASDARLIQTKRPRRSGSPQGVMLTADMEPHHLARTLYNATDGKPQEWRRLEELDRNVALVEEMWPWWRK